MMERELGEGYSFTKKKCFVCGSLSHLIKDCDYYEKKMAREAEVKKQRVVNTGNGVAKPVWTNANRVNHSNKFVPRSVQLNTGRTNINSVRPNINTGRTNVNPVRPRVNTGSSNVNSVRSRKPVPTKTSNSFSPKRPQVNQFNQRGHFSKSYSSVRRPFAKTTAQMSHFHAVKGNWGSAVKTSAGYNWRNSNPNSNCDSGPTFIRTDHPLKNMVDRGIFDSGCSGHMTGLVTPSMTNVNASGEEQVEDISPNTLEAAKTLSRVASLKPKSIDKGRRYKRRKETKGKKVVTSLDFQEEVDTGAKGVNTAEGVNTGSIKVSTVSEQVSTGSTKRSIPSPDKGQREGKAPMIIEEAPKKSKEQILQEEASLAEAIRLDTLQKEEVAKQVHLDSLLAQRIAEEEELNEQQKKRRAQVQFEAQHYTDEDWDLIRAKIEANAELSKSMLGSDLQGEDFAKKMVDLVNQRKKYFAEERARAKRNKPMTQSQLKTYMMNYLKNQGTWKLSQLKNLSFEEVKEEFDKLVKQVESFAPINFEATKASLKRFGEELQTKTTKRLKDDEAKDAEPAKKSGKRRKQMARKGLHTDLDKDDSEDSDEVSEQEDSVSGTKIPINPVPVAMKSPSIATYKIIKQGEKGVYQIVREDGTDIVYINFGAMLKDISRDDLTELYRIVMNRYGMDGPEDELEKISLRLMSVVEDTLVYPGSGYFVNPYDTVGYQFVAFCLRRSVSADSELSQFCYSDREGVLDDNYFPIENVLIIAMRMSEPGGKPGGRIDLRTIGGR
ncbi:hypothetical protein Tco_0670997 [Tanacetum coccineum]